MRVSSILAAILLASTVIPGSASAADCTDGYTIRPGDSLGKIARKCGSTVEAIVAANDRIRNPSQIAVGWTIKVPGSVQNRAQPTNAAVQTSEPLELTGRIVNGRWCAHLETPDGETWGLISSKVLLRSGTNPTLHGHLTDSGNCNTSHTLLVTGLDG